MRKLRNDKRATCVKLHQLKFEVLDDRLLLAGDLVARWSADDLNNTYHHGEKVATWVDSVAGIVATATGEPRLEKDAFGAHSSLVFNASDGADYLTVLPEHNPVAGLTALSVSVVFAAVPNTAVGGQNAWFSNTGLVNTDPAEVRYDWGIALNQAGNIAGGAGNGVLGQAPTVYSTADVADGELHVATLTWTGTTLALYLDQLPALTRNDASAQARDALPMMIGSLSRGRNPFTGQIAEIRLYDGALSAAEVEALYAQVTAPTAVEDFYFATPSAPLQVNVDEGVLRNDAAVVASPTWQAVLVQPPARGTLNLAGDGSFTFTPATTFTSGVDSFTYRIQMGNSISQDVPVMLVINTETDSTKIVINELNVDPDIATERIEFIELHNPGDIPVDLSGWRIDGGVTAVFPAGAKIAAGGYFVVAEDLAAFHEKFALVADVQFAGRLSNAGETIELRTPTGTLIDRVDYGQGFPWPTVGEAPGYSMELIHPSLDNQLGGSWRSSIGQQTLINSESSWRYFKGTQEPPGGTLAWRSAEFDDTSWSEGTGAIGFSARVPVKTPLSDMRNGYTSFFLRRVFQVDDPASIGRLRLQALYDDGFNVWINGMHVLRENLTSDELPFDGVADGSKSETTYADFDFPNPTRYLVPGANVIAIQVFNAVISNNDAYFDARLVDLNRPAAGPTPGAANSIYSLVAPPQLRQVDHQPQQPRAQQDVAISIKATDPDGVGSVSLGYQLVDPGQYVRLTDAAFNQWTHVPMYDDGTHGDLTPDDDVYTAVLPAALQIHRRLVRYRIHAADTLGNVVTVPNAEDPQPNFAYFVYDGVPAWTAADRPGNTDPVTFSADVMNQLPVYHLIANSGDVTRSQYVSTAEEQLFYGTMVYDGIVYDHISFGVRGEFSTYVSGKNKWKFHFTRGHGFQARDNYGNPNASTWRTMNFSSASTPWVEMNRGMGGIDEAIAYRLYELAGNPSSKTNFLQFRVIDDVEESPSSQYDGDLWGLYLTIEHPDGRFLDERGLPDGTTYKVEGGAGDIKNQGDTQPDAARDFSTMMSGANLRNTEEWWRENIDLDVYFTFRAINRAINNMDLRDGWNHYLYHNPETNLWETLPWDLDMLYVPTTHWSGVIRFENALRHSALEIEYMNRARELQDLLFSVDQVQQLVGEYASFVNPQHGGWTMADVDQYLWNYHPRASTSGDDVHRGAFFKQVADYDRFIGANGVRRLVSADHEGMAQWIEDFLLPAPGGGSTPAGYGAEQLNQHVVDPAIPNTPVVSYIGEPNYSADGLLFRTSPFADPDAGESFAALQWRLAKVTDRNAPAFDPSAPPDYEIRSVWESGELTTFSDTVAIPANSVEPGHAYRVRVRMKDPTGRYSHWSDPLQFIATAGSPTELLNGLRISEVHYNPGETTAAEIAAGFVDNEEFEFIELTNIGTSNLDLRSVRLVEIDTLDGGVEGVEFDFSTGEITQLAPGQRVVVVENLAAFRIRYGNDVPVAGQWSGRLDNGGETITLTAAGTNIQQFAYSDDWYDVTDGVGAALEVIDVRQTNLSNWNTKEAWRPSVIGGTPGTAVAANLPGDSNHDGIFNSSDLVLIFQAGKYDDGIDRNASFEEGDWNGDGDFDSSDLVYAFAFGFYVAESRRSAK